MPGNSVFGSTVTRMIKSKDYMVGRFRGEFGLK